MKLNFNQPYYKPPEIPQDVDDIITTGMYIDINTIKNMSHVKNIPVNVSDGNNNNLIHLIIMYKKKSEHQIINFIKYLVNNNTNPDQPNNSNKTPLHYACLNQYYYIIEYLLSIDCNPNFKDDFGMTPLHYLLVGKYDIFEKESLNPGSIIGYKDKQIDLIKNNNILQIKKELFDEINNNNIFKQYLEALKKTLNPIIISNKITRIISESMNNNDIPQDIKIKNLRAELENQININPNEFNFPDIEIHETDNFMESLPNDKIGAIKNMNIKENFEKLKKNNLLLTNNKINEFINKINKFIDKMKNIDINVINNINNEYIEFDNNNFNLTNKGQKKIFNDLQINTLISYSKKYNFLIGYNDNNYYLFDETDFDIYDYNYDITNLNNIFPPNINLMSFNPNNPIFKTIMDEDLISMELIKQRHFLYLKNAYNKGLFNPIFIFNSYKLKFFGNIQDNNNIDNIFNYSINNQDKNIFPVLVFIILCPNIRLFNFVFNKNNNTLEIENGNYFNLNNNWSDKKLYKICKKVQQHFNLNYDIRNNIDNTNKFIKILEEINKYRKISISKCNNNLYKDIIFILKYFNHLDYDNLNNYPLNYNNLKSYITQFLKLIYNYENPPQNFTLELDQNNVNNFRPEYNLPKFKFYYNTRNPIDPNNLFYEIGILPGNYGEDINGTNLINIAYILDFDCLGKINETPLYLNNNIIASIKYSSTDHIKIRILDLINTKTLFNNIDKIKNFFNDIYHNVDEYTELSTIYLQEFIKDNINLNELLNYFDNTYNYTDLFDTIISNFNQINRLNFLEIYFDNNLPNNINKFYINDIPLINNVNIIEYILYNNVNPEIKGLYGNHFINNYDNNSLKFSFSHKNTYSFNINDKLPQCLENSESIMLFLQIFIKKILLSLRNPDNTINQKFDNLLNNILNKDKINLIDSNELINKWYLLADILKKLFITYTNHIITNYLNNIINETTGLSDFFPIHDDDDNFIVNLDNDINIDKLLKNKKDNDDIIYYNFNKVKEKDIFIIYPDDYSNLEIEKNFTKLKINDKIIIKMLEYGGQLDILDGNNKLPLDNIIDNHYYKIFENITLSDNLKFDINNKYEHGYLQYALKSHKNHINRFIFNKTNNIDIINLFVKNQLKDITSLLKTNEFKYNIYRHNDVSFKIIHYLTNQYLTQYGFRFKDKSNKSNYDLSNVYQHNNILSLWSQDMKENIKLKINKYSNIINKYNKEANKSNRLVVKINELQQKIDNLKNILNNLNSNKSLPNSNLYKYNDKLLRSYNSNSGVIEAEAWYDLFNQDILNNSEYLQLFYILKKENKLEMKSLGDIMELINNIPYYEFLETKARSYFENPQFYNSNKVGLFLKELLIYCTKIIICPQIEIFTKKILLTYYKKVNPTKNDYQNMNLIDSLFNQDKISNNSPRNKLYNLAEVIVKNAINWKDTIEEKASFNNQTITEIISEWLNLFTHTSYISINEDSDIIYLLNNNIGRYFENFIFKMIRNWVVIFENNLEFVINHYRILKVIENIIKI